MKNNREYIGEEIIIERPDGTRLMVLAHASPIHDEVGQLTGALNILVNIDERRQAEEAIRQARDAAESLNRAKDRFIAVLSHELRTPLCPVLMTLSAMEDDPDLHPKFREDLAVIRKNLELETSLIDDLLDVSRVINGKLRLHMQPVRIHDLLEDVVQSCQSDLNGKQLKLRRQFRAGNDCVTADQARLHQVFWNLLGNATKFTADGGEIVISTSNEGTRIQVQIQDSGIGIAPEALPRIFGAFEQGERTAERQVGGLGLGLTIAKAIVEMHGGTLGATSPGPGQGATFLVGLEVTAESLAQTTSRAAPGNRSSPGARVLLVEDHSDSARILSRLLSEAGCRVKIAGSVAEAVQLAAAEPFDVLVSDIGLPDASGYDLMVELKRRYGIQGIALSGYGAEQDIQRSLEAGFADHMVKPVSVALLRAAIEALAPRNCSAPPAA